MNKYSPLKQHLLRLKEETWKATFTEIEEVLGFRLPKSAREYPAWWGNQEYSSQSQAWQTAGWRVSNLNLTGETIQFHKDDLASILTTQKKRTSKKANKPSETLEPYPWDKDQSIDCQLEMRWIPIGKLLLNSDGRVAFPAAEPKPALYRLRVRSNSGEAVYIGETVNLRRRFGNYRNPGNSQQTSLRINAVLKETLKQGAEISVSAITSTAWIISSSGREQADFSSKVVRCLFENAALVSNGGADIDMLNRAST